MPIRFCFRPIRVTCSTAIPNRNRQRLLLVLVPATESAAEQAAASDQVPAAATAPATAATLAAATVMRVAAVQAAVVAEPTTTGFLTARTSRAELASWRSPNLNTP